MSETKYHKPSKQWTKRRILLVVGLFIVGLLLINWLMPVILRSNRGLIQKKITDIQALPDSQQERQFKILLSATGGDQPVARGLADYYKKHNNWREAAKTYQAANPKLFIESATSSTEAYDFENAKSAAKQSISAKQTGGEYWLAVAELNLGETDKGCQLINKLTERQKSQVESACRLLQGDIPSNQASQTAYKLFDLGIPLKTQSILDKTDPKTSSDLLLLAHINQRLGKTSAAIENLSAAIKADPWNKTILAASQSLCSGISTSDTRETEQCKPLADKAKQQLQLLLPQ